MENIAEGLNALVDADNPTGRSYPEDFTHENGNYFCSCIVCSKQFCGHKRRMVCKRCSSQETTTIKEFADKTREQALNEAAWLKLTHNLTSFEIGQAAARLSIGIKSAKTDTNRAKEKSQ